MDGEINGDHSPSAAVAVQSHRQDSIARFLYNHNPFYLISCLLVIYGFQSFALSGRGLIEKSISMTGGIAAYAILMAFICVAVVRIAKVWDDARSIFIVVVISLVAVTTGFDELCIDNRPLALALGCSVGFLVVLVTEGVIRLCNIRLGFWYRTTYYLLLCMMIGFPILLGRAVAHRNDSLANWGSVLFSIAVAASALAMIPALRRGQDAVRDNGTPWTWPLYPLSAFFVLLVLAGIRSHALWMSFGFVGVAGKFEPFLLLPILAAVMLLLAETGLGRGNESLQRLALIGTSGLLLCASTHDGATWLPIQEDLRTLCGSSLTVTLAVVFAVYLWMTARGVRQAIYGLPATLVVTGLAAPLPAVAPANGIASWMFPAAACAMLLAMTFRMISSDWIWTAFAGVAATTIAMVGDEYGQPNIGLVVSSVFATTAMLVIGARFDSHLAVVLRHLAATVMLVAVAFIFFRSTQQSQGMIVYAGVVLVPVSSAYGLIIRKRGWFRIAIIQTVICLATVGLQQHRSGSLRRINWPIASGMICLCVGIAITTGKSERYQKLAGIRDNESFVGLDPGL